MKLTKETRNYFLLRKSAMLLNAAHAKDHGASTQMENGKLNHRDTILIQRVKGETIYKCGSSISTSTCGSSLSPPGHERVTSIVVKRSLPYEILPMKTAYYSTKRVPSIRNLPMKTAYYSTKNTTYPLVWFHCRGHKSSICSDDT